MSSLGAILFDLDGVLTDTAEFHYQAWKKLADDLSLPFNREKNDLLRGVSRRESLHIVLSGQPVTETEADIFMTQKNEYYKKLISTMTPLDVFPGVKRLLYFLRSRKVKLAIASVSKNAKMVLTRLEITGYFDTVTDGYAVQKSKPEPDIFVETAKQLSTPQQNCVVVEDAAAGIIAAHRAGMAAIGIGKAAKEADASLPFIGSIDPQKFLLLASTLCRVKGGEYHHVL
jgi:beta-phosphoglucomutase